MTKQRSTIPLSVKKSSGMVKDKILCSFLTDKKRIPHESKTTGSFGTEKHPDGSNLATMLKLVTAAGRKDLRGNGNTGSHGYNNGVL